MATTQDVVRFRLGQDAIERALRKDIRALWLRMSGSSPESIREAFFDAMPSLVGKYGVAASTLGAEYFEGLTGGSAVLAEGVADRAVLASTGWAMDYLSRDDPGGALNAALSSMSRHAMQYGRSTIAASTARSNRFLYARVPNAKACSWCLMLASRGAVYGSRRDAGAKDEGNEYHDDCYCVPTAVPVSSGDEDLPYDRQGLYDMYRKAWDEVGAGASDSEVAAKMRELFALK